MSVDQQVAQRGNDDARLLELPPPPKSGVGLSTYAVAIRLADIVLMLAATLVGWQLWNRDPTAPHAEGWLHGYLLWAVPIVVVWYAFLEAADAYELERVGSAARELKAVFSGTGVIAAGFAFVSFAARASLSRTFFAVAFGLGMVLLLVSHWTMRAFLRHAHCQGLYMRPVVVVGARGPVTALVRELERARWAGMQVVAACVPETEAWEPIGDVRWVLPTASLRDVVLESGANHVFLTAGAGETPRHVRRIAWSLEGTDAELAVVPALTDIAGGRIHPRPVAGLPLIGLEQPQLSGLQSISKRTVDLLGSGLLLVLLSPLFAVLAILIKRDDGGPVFYRQTRVGREGREFCCLKLRSMVVDADRRLAALTAANEAHGFLFKLREDPRVTRVGRMIRKYSLDELPQLVNVLRGEMSLVGPRPPLPSEVASYHADMVRRLKVRPGMTGLWQVSGRSDLTADESERLDLYYVDNWSLTYDLGILWRTIWVVLKRKGAY